MPVFRWLFIGLLAWIAYRVWSQYAIVKGALKTVEQQKSTTALMVKCAQCEVHIPEQHAIKNGDDWFCCTQHKDEFNAT